MLLQKKAPVSAGFIHFGAWMAAENLIAIQPKVVEIFQWWTNVPLESIVLVKFEVSPIEIEWYESEWMQLYVE